MPGTASADLIRRLADAVGAAHVLTGADTEGYGTEVMGKYRWAPLAVVRPGSADEVTAILKLCAAAGVGVVPSAGRTGLTGASEAEGRVMLSVARMNRIREVRASSRIAIVEAGVILSRLHEAAAEQGLVFPLTFGAKGSAMVGGFLSTNAGGSNVVRYGSTRGLCLGIEVVLADGRVLNLMSELRKDNSGYDLKDLFIGAEGTLGIITAAVLRLFPKPAAYASAMVAVTSIDAALALLNRLQTATGGLVEAFEYMPGNYMDRLAEIRPGRREPFARRHDHNIFVEIASTAPKDAEPRPDGTVPLTAMLEAALAESLESGGALDATVAASEAQRREMWEGREAAAEVMVLPVPTVDLDLSLPLEKVQAFLDRMADRLAALDPGSRWMAISHLGDGNIHYSAYGTTRDPEVLDAIRIGADTEAVALGGSFSAEHGIGLAKKASMARLKDPVALDVMRALKAALDPANLLNPGKVLP
ncbi:MAG: FAD-binding oxidoreductase [Paracoccaceae bacterium]